jgi:hypothetical protein
VILEFLDLRHDQRQALSGTVASSFVD